MKILLCRNFQSPYQLRHGFQSVKGPWSSVDVAKWLNLQTTVSFLKLYYREGTYLKYILRILLKHLFWLNYTKMKDEKVNKMLIEILENGILSIAFS